MSKLTEVINATLKRIEDEQHIEILYAIEPATDVKGFFPGDFKRVMFIYRTNDPKESRSISTKYVTRHNIFFKGFNIERVLTHFSTQPVQMISTLEPKVIYRVHPIAEPLHDKMLAMFCPVVAAIEFYRASKTRYKIAMQRIAKDYPKGDGKITANEAMWILYASYMAMWILKSNCYPAITYDEFLATMNDDDRALYRRCYEAAPGSADDAISPQEIWTSSERLRQEFRAAVGEKYKGYDPDDAPGRCVHLAYEYEQLKSVYDSIVENKGDKKDE